MIVPVAVSLAVMMVAVAYDGRHPAQPSRRLGSRVPVEEVVVNLSAAFTNDAIAAQRDGAPVHVARLRLGAPGRMAGGVRRAIVAPPLSAIRFRATAPAGAVLRFGIGVQRPVNVTTAQTGTRFSVDVNGRERFTRTLEASDRGWRNGRVDLHLRETSEIELTLRTERREGEGDNDTRPGWSEVRIVRESVADRQGVDADHPSVLLLVLDTLRTDRLGCYGATPSPTPELDRLTMRGTLFEHAVAQAPWTLPAVATLFTGLHPRSHGMMGAANDDSDQAHGESSYLSDSLPTLASVARAQGVSTIAISTNPLVSRRTNLARGFETFVGFGPRGQDGWQRARRVNAAFIDWLRANRDHRFLAVLHYMDMHAPYAPPPRYRPVAPAGLDAAVERGDIARLERDMDEVGRRPDAAELAHLRTLYDAQLRYWDDQLAWLLEALRTLELAAKTRIIVTADHGEGFLEHGHLGHGSDLHEEQIRMPLVIVGPGVPVARVQEQAQAIDLFPTVAATLGIDVSDDLPGQDLLSHRAARPAVSETRRAIGPDGRRIELLSVRTPRWKLVHAPAFDRFELYDLTEDPGEQRNRYAEAPAGAGLAAALGAWRQQVREPPVAVGRDRGFQDKLRALGYVE